MNLKSSFDCPCKVQADIDNKKLNLEFTTSPRHTPQATLSVRQVGIKCIELTDTFIWGFNS